WIWTVTGSAGTDAKLEDALQIEWAKAWARTRRWNEEVLLLEEEYRQVWISFEHEAQIWDARAKAVPVGVMPVEVAEGTIAYAVHQAGMYCTLVKRVVTAW
ncbi:hypothetical protein B0H13DRAFT_1568575, partial [Mycena leptocephala]